MEKEKLLVTAPLHFQETLLHIFPQQQPSFQARSALVSNTQRMHEIATAVPNIVVTSRLSPTSANQTHQLHTRPSINQALFQRGWSDLGGLTLASRPKKKVQPTKRCSNLELGNEFSFNCKRVTCFCLSAVDKH